MADEKTGNETAPPAPEYMTPEAAQKMVNAALAQTKKASRDEISALRQSYDELKALMTQTAESATQAAAPKPGVEDDEKRALSKALKEMQARDKDREKSLAELTEKSAKAEARARARREESEFAKAWGTAKLDTGYAGDVLARLRVAGQIRVDDDEDVFVGEEPLAEWVTKLAAGEEGKRYKPARDAGGEGSVKGRGGAPGATNGAAPSLSEAKSILASVMMRGLGGGNS